ncbi:hypothetical protein [Microvirga terricola]|uniref:Uncharacterized protein n=1 Tax=Microvirga terricola TaxID=2719797 RepID=A0ABX0VA96_9HYPH|nr:hypothetical protein [Microvirga terricola]NIX75316.1 hypothetical protein [Microvirga terricola]
MDIETWRTTVDAAYLTMARTQRERLRWITLIMAVRVVRLGDDLSDEVIKIIEQLTDELRACAMMSGYLKRGTRWAGVVEIDLVHPKLLGSETKRDLIGTLAGVDPNSLAPDQRLIVVHLHAVVDCKGHAKPDLLVRDMRKCWPGPRRVHSASIWEDGTVAENLTRLASYSTKLWSYYSEAWEGRPTRRLMDREPEWDAWMDRLIDNVGLSNMIVASVSSRALWCPRDDEESLVASGFDEDADETQLNNQDNPQKPQIMTIMKAIMEKKNNAALPSNELSRRSTPTIGQPSRNHQAAGSGRYPEIEAGHCLVIPVASADEARPTDRDEAG